MGVVQSKELSIDYKINEGEDIKVVKWAIEDGDTEQEYTLSDLVAQGYDFCYHVDKYQADAIFIEKNISYEFKVKREHKNLKLIGTTELDADTYGQFHIGMILELPTNTMTHDVPIADLPVGDAVQVQHRVYVSRDFSQRVLSLFLVSEDNTILILARCLIVKKEELGKFDNLYGAAETIAERESRIKRLVSELSEHTFFRIYSEDHLARAIMMTQSVVMPQVQYWVTSDVYGKNTEVSPYLGLAYRYYEAKEDPIATVILVATDSYFTSPLAWQLSTNHKIDVYVCCPRGFGPSEGYRGYAEKPTSIWSDIAFFVKMVRKSSRLSKPLFLAGHFWGAAMCVKYSLWSKKIDVEGFILVSPNIGRNMMKKEFLDKVRTEKTAEVHMSALRIIIWRMSGGRIGGRKIVLKLQSDPLIRELDTSMVDSVSLNTFGSWMFTDTKPKKMKEPTLVIYGDQDEFFDSKKALALFPDSKTVELVGEDSLTIIGASVSTVSQWVLSQAANHSPIKRPLNVDIVSEAIELKNTIENTEISCIILNCSVTPLDLNITTYECSTKNADGVARSLKHLLLNNPRKRLILATDCTIEKKVYSLANAFITRRVSENYRSWVPDDPKLQEHIETFCKRTIDPLEEPEPLNHDFNVSAYESLELVGKGSFGTVWLARTLATGKPVAIKQIPKSSLATAGELDAIKSELSILCKVRHNPHTVTLLNYGQDISNIYFVCDYVIGGELFSRMKRLRGRMPEKEAKFYIGELAAALNSLHESGMVYRDLKPENVLISASGHIKLTDFGFATTLDYGEKLSSFCGSPYYIAPEMLISEAYDSAIDWWALGILMYELLVGQPPFTAKTPMEVYRAILVGDIDWTPLKSNVDAQQLIKGLLKSDPQKRFRYADIQRSAWFAGVNWKQIESRSSEPPLVVNTTSPFDTSYFVKYRKDEARFGPSVTNRESVHVTEFSQ